MKNTNTTKRSGLGDIGKPYSFDVIATKKNGEKIKELRVAYAENKEKAKENLIDFLKNKLHYTKIKAIGGREGHEKRNQMAKGGLVVNPDMEFTKGTYYIGDLCYVMKNQWDEVCDLTIKGNDALSGVFTLKDGTQFAIYGTAYGDGEFYDQEGNSYSVDSGTLGCVKVSSKIDVKSAEGLGMIVKIDNNFTTGYNDKNQTEIFFDNILINTAAEEDDYESDYDEDEDEYGKGGGVGVKPVTYYVAYTSYFDTNKYDVEKMTKALKKLGATNIHTENDGGKSNQPEVVVFDYKGDGTDYEPTKAVQKAFDTDWIIIRVKNWRTKKMAKGGMLEHGLEVGDEIMTRHANLIFVRKNGKQYVININTGKRLTQSEFDKMDNKTQNNFSIMAKGGGVGDLEYSDIYNVLKEKIDEAIDEVPNDFENASDYNGEEVEHRSRDGFMAFTNGGYEASWMEYISSFHSSGKSLPTKQLDEELERQVEYNYSAAKERFIEEYPEIVEELGEDNIDYNSLYEANYGDEAEQLSEWEMDFSDDSILCKIGAFYYDTDNYRGMDGKHTVRLFGAVNLESPYHRPGNLEDSYDFEFTFDSIEELKERVDEGLEKIIAWFEGEYYNDSLHKLKINRMAKGGNIYSKGTNGRYHILGEIKGKAPMFFASLNDRKKIKNAIKDAKTSFKEFGFDSIKIFVVDSSNDEEIYNYGKGGGIKRKNYSYIPQEDIDYIATESGKKIDGSKVLDGAYVKGKFKNPKIVRGYFEEEEYGKGGRVKYYLNGFEENINYILDSTDAVEVKREGNLDNGNLVIYFETRDDKKAKGGGVGKKDSSLLFDLDYGDVFQITGKNHTQTGSYFVFIELSDKYGASLKVKPFPDFDKKSYLAWGDSYIYIGGVKDGDIRILSKEEAAKMLLEYQIRNKKFAKGGGVDSDNEDTPKVYVADLAAYNEGKLIGEWIDLSKFDSGEEVMKEIGKLLGKWSKAQKVRREEFAIHDYENFSSSLYSEYMGEKSFDNVIKAYKISQERDIPQNVIGDIINEYEPDDIEDFIEEHYAGQFDSDEDLAYWYVDNMLGGFENMSNKQKEIYFDYEAFGRDLAINDYYDRDGYYFQRFKKGGNITNYDLNKYATGGKVKKKYIIQDWAGNHLFRDKVFNSFEEGWDFIYENVKEESEDDGTYDDYYVVAKDEMALGGGIDTDQSYFRVFKNSKGKDVSMKIVPNPIMNKYDFYVNGQLRGSFKTFEQAENEIGRENIEMYGVGGDVKAFFSAAKEKFKSGYYKSKEWTKKQIHDKKKQIALEVLKEVKKKKTTSREEKLASDKAYKLVSKKYAKGGKISREVALDEAIKMGVDFEKDVHAQSFGNELSELAKRSGFRKAPSSSYSTGRAFFYHLQKIYNKRKSGK